MDTSGQALPCGISLLGLYVPKARSTGNRYNIDTIRDLDKSEPSSITLIQQTLTKPNSLGPALVQI